MKKVALFENNILGIKRKSIVSSSHNAQ